LFLAQREGAHRESGTVAQQDHRLDQVGVNRLARIGGDPIVFLTDLSYNTHEVAKLLGFARYCRFSGRKGQQGFGPQPKHERSEPGP
jgi:hypothetical protein